MLLAAAGGRVGEPEREAAADSAIDWLRVMRRPGASYMGSVASS
jgi:hypothetical protein